MAVCVITIRLIDCINAKQAPISVLVLCCTATSNVIVKSKIPRSMSKSAAGSKASTADSKSGQSPTVEMPLSALEAELRAALNKSADEEYMPSESLDTLMMDTIDQIINGTVKAAQLIALLKEIGLKAVETTINSSIVNVLWLYGTQVRDTSQFLSSTVASAKRTSIGPTGAWNGPDRELPQPSHFDTLLNRPHRPTLLPRKADGTRWPCS